MPEAQDMAFVALGPVKANSIAIEQLAAPQKVVSATRGSTARIPWSMRLFTCCSA